jgi:hypothetical protein
MNELTRILILTVILLLINFIMLKMLPSLQINLNGTEMYLFYLNILFIFYIILPKNVGNFFS